MDEMTDLDIARGLLHESRQTTCDAKNVGCCTGADEGREIGGEGIHPRTHVHKHLLQPWSTEIEKKIDRNDRLFSESVCKITGSLDRGPFVF
jgi:hypothetical protein